MNYFLSQFILYSLEPETFSASRMWRCKKINSGTFFRNKEVTKILCCWGPEKPALYLVLNTLGINCPVGWRHRAPPVLHWKQWYVGGGRFKPAGPASKAWISLVECCQASHTIGSMQTDTTILWVFGGSSTSVQDYTCSLFSKSQELFLIIHK